MSEPNDDPIIVPAAQLNDDPIIVPAVKARQDKGIFGLGLRTTMQSGALGPLAQFVTRANPDSTPARTGKGLQDAFQSGFQNSAGALLVRGKLPDVVLDPQHAKWYEKLVAGAGQLAGDFPVMVGGGAAAGLLGIESGPGAAVAAGAGAFAAPTALREALTTAYSLNQVQTSGEFLSRVGVGIKQTAKDALVGGLTGGAGNVVGTVAKPLGAFGSGAAQLATEGTVMTVAPAALEGRLPEPEDFTNAAIMLVGLKGAHVAAAKLRAVYARTGVEPLQVLADAKKDPSIVADLLKEPTLETGAGREELQANREPGAVRSEDADAAPGLGREAPAPAPADAGRRPASSQDAFDAAHFWETPAGLEARDAAPTEKFLEYKSGDPGPIPRAYRDADALQAAADAVPGLAPAVGSELMYPRREVPGEPSPTHVNYRYLNTPDHVNAALARMSELNLEAIQNQRRGTVSWEQTQMEAGKVLSELLGSPEDMAAPRQAGTPAGAAELLARKQMVEGAALDASEQARQLMDLGANASPEQVASFLASIDRAAMIQAEFLGARAEAGRALNILKETKIAAERAQQIQELIGRFGKDPKELAAMVAELDNPASVLKFAREATKATTWDKVIETWKSALVSGPITQTANFMGNTSFLALRPAVDALAATVGAITRAPERVSFAEPFARIFGNLQGVADGLKFARAAFFEDAPGGKAEHKHAIEGRAGYIIRTPFRALSAGDALFRTMNERGEAYTLATREAVADGFNPATREFRERVAEIAGNPSEAQIEQIQQAGARFVFNSPLGEKGRAVQQFVKAWHLEYAVPFISTPGNVFKEMARLTPAAPIVGEWKAAVAKGGPEAQKAIAEVALGTGLSALAMSLAMAGHVSGNGDPDPAKRRVKMAAGWQPYSIKVGGTWYSYQRFQPVGTLLGFAADMAEAWEHLTPEESDKVPKILATAFANAVTNQTFLQGMALMVDAIAKPDRDGPRFIQNLAGSFVPAIAGQTAQMMDPYQREVTSIREAVQNRIPGVREALPPKRDPFGEPVASPDRIGGISPVTVKAQSEDKVRTEAARLGVGASAVPKSIQLPAAGVAKVGKVDLTSEQRDIFGDVAGHTAYQVLHGIVNSPGWDYMPDLVKEKAYKVAFEKSAQAGKVAALSDEQRQKEIQRIISEVSKRLKPPDSAVH